METKEKKSYKILIVDDDSAFRRVVADGFIELGHTVLEAVNGVEGFKIAKKEKPDMILLDVLMPEKGGPETLVDLRADEDTKNIPTLMLTQVDSVSTIADSLSTGVSGYIIKNELSVDEIIKRTLNAI